MRAMGWNSRHDDFPDLEHDLPRGAAKHGKTGELGHGVGWEAQVFFGPLLVGLY